MHLYLVNFLRLLHGLCLLYSVIGAKIDIEDSRSKTLTTYPKTTSLDSRLMRSLLYAENRMKELGEIIVVCSDALCEINQDRNKRSAVSDSPVAQNKQTDTADKSKHTSKSITRYAFGNPALPGPSKKRNGKTKSKKPKG